MEMKAEPTREHAWLGQLVGKWTCEAEMHGEPGQTPEKTRGTETVRSLGGLWFLFDGEGEMPGGAGHATMQMTLGYDPQRKAFVGTWVGSMMTHLWVYSGTLDAAKGELALESEGPSMAGDGSMAPYRDVIAVVTKDYRKLTSHMRAEDGSWRPFMTAHYHRAT